MKTLLKLLHASILLAGLVVGAHAAGISAVPLYEEPKPGPDLSFADASGKAMTLQDWRGKVVLVNVWATWCAPCREEMPTLDRLQKKLGSDKFEVVALSVDQAGASVVKKFFDEIGVENLGILVDEQMGALRELAIYGLPATILINAKGQEIGRVVGPAEWDTPEMVTFLDSVVKAQGQENRRP